MKDEEIVALEGEIWETLKEEGLENYAISNMGRCKNEKLKRLLKPSLFDNKGHKRYVFWFIRNNKSISKLINTLVATHFLHPPNTNKRYLIAHKDNDISNNKAENLEYRLFSQEMRDLKREKKSTPKILKSKFGLYSNITVNNKSWQVGIFKHKQHVYDAVSVVIENLENDLEWIFAPYFSKQFFIDLIKENKSDSEIITETKLVFTEHYASKKKKQKLLAAIQELREELNRN